MPRCNELCNGYSDYETTKRIWIDFLLSLTWLAHMGFLKILHKQSPSQQSLQELFKNIGERFLLFSVEKHRKKLKLSLLDDAWEM